jgi:hypothetical protein
LEWGGISHAIASDAFLDSDEKLAGQKGFFQFQGKAVGSTCFMILLEGGQQATFQFKPIDISQHGSSQMGIEICLQFPVVLEIKTVYAILFHNRTMKYHTVANICNT